MALKNHPQEIKTHAQASAIPNVGPKMADKIMEIINEGSLQKVKEVCESEKLKILDLFSRVWGAGPKTADKWYEQGFRTLDDLVSVKVFDELFENQIRISGRRKKPSSASNSK